jgi:hypothetical protein
MRGQRRALVSFYLACEVSGRSHTLRHDLQRRPANHTLHSINDRESTPSSALRWPLCRFTHAFGRRAEEGKALQHTTTRRGEFRRSFRSRNEGYVLDSCVIFVCEFWRCRKKRGLVRQEWDTVVDGCGVQACRAFLRRGEGEDEAERWLQGVPERPV